MMQLYKYQTTLLFIAFQAGIIRMYVSVFLIKINISNSGTPLCVPICIHKKWSWLITPDSWCKIHLILTITKYLEH